MRFSAAIRLFGYQFKHTQIRVNHAHTAQVGNLRHFWQSPRLNSYGGVYEESTCNVASDNYTSHTILICPIDISIFMCVCLISSSR